MTEKDSGRRNVFWRKDNLRLQNCGERIKELEMLLSSFYILIFIGGNTHSDVLCYIDLVITEPRLETKS